MHATYKKALALDAGACNLLLAHWILVAFAVDRSACAEDLSTRKFVALYLAVMSIGVNIVLIAISYAHIGSDKDIPPHQRVTVLGLLFEVCALIQGWGAAFLCAQTWSLEVDNLFHASGFLAQTSKCMFEASLLQSGVGWVAAPPTTLAERLVAWFVCIVGGTWIVNIMIVGVVMGNRFWWLQVA